MKHQHHRPLTLQTPKRGPALMPMNGSRLCWTGLQMIGPRVIGPQVVGLACTGLACTDTVFRR